MTTVARMARGAAVVLGTGYVLVFFSEVVFWSVWRPGEDPFGRVMAWLLYSLLGYLTLAAIRHFRLADGWDVMLAGAVFGWLTEGVVAMTVFGDPSMPFPFTIVWTAIAWHAPLSMLLGWYALGLALRDARPWPAIALSAGLGLFWGAWALGWASETPPVVATPDEFAVHAVVTTIGLTVAHVCIAAGRPEAYAPSRIGVWLAGAATLAFFALVTVPTVQVMAAVLPALLLALWLVLRRCRAGRAEGSLLARFGAPIRARNLAALALMPAAASAVYGPASTALPPMSFVHPGFALLTSLAGTALFAVAVARAMRRRR